MDRVKSTQGKVLKVKKDFTIFVRFECNTMLDSRDKICYI